jgi:hypothetical protein
MSIRVYCPECDESFRVGDHLAGRRAMCPECSEMVDVPDPDDPDDRPVRRHRRTPADHLPAWRRVSFGFLLQQGAALLLLLGLGLFVTGVVLDDPNDPNDPPLHVLVLKISGGVVLFCGFALQAAGRWMSAFAPVRATKAIGVTVAVLSLIQLLVFLALGILVAIAEADVQPGAVPDMTMAVLAMFGACGWTALVVGNESCHCFSVASVGRVLKSNGALVMGRALGVLVPVGGVLGLISFCVLAVWLDKKNPNGQNQPGPEDEQVAVAVLVALAAICALYLLFDVVLLQQGRAAVAGIPAGAGDGADPDADWE